MIRLFIIFTTSFSLIYSSELSVLDSFLIRIEQDLHKAQTMEEKGLGLAQLQKVLVSFLKVPQENEDFHSFLKKSRPSVDRILDHAASLYSYLYSEEVTRRVPLIINGKSCVAFLNLNGDRYEEELRNWQSYNLYFPPQELTSSALADLEPGISYNFIVSLEGKVIFSDEQLTSKGMDGQKNLLGPNHAILAKGEPVLTAGEFIIFQKGDRKLLFASSTSGHYRPDFSSFQIFEEALIKIGFPEEATFLSPLRLSSIGWLFLQR